MAINRAFQHPGYGKSSPNEPSSACEFKGVPPGVNLLRLEIPHFRLGELSDGSIVEDIALANAPR